MREKINHFRELNVYKLAKEVALQIFELSKNFPVEERYSLTDQIRSSSRSVCANLAEAWKKRRYKAAFIAKLNDCESECSETQVWLEFATDFKYIGNEMFQQLDDKCDKISRMLVLMMSNSEKWIHPIKVTKD